MAKMTFPADLEIPIRVQPRTLLLIEDDGDTARLVTLTLRAAPHWTVMHAPTGQEAVELARREVPDLILLDHHLPDFSGIEVLKILGELPETSKIPVFSFSAQHKSGWPEGQLAGAIAKPFSPLDLRRTIDDFFAPH